MLNVLCLGITLFVILGLALVFHVLLRINPEESWASAVMTILLLVYVTGLLGNTQYALIVIYLAAAVGIIMAMAALVRKSEYSLKTIFTPGIIMMFGIAGIGIVAFKGIHVCNWDELYQWGKAANFMLEYDRLAGGSDFEGESILLSSTTFFHYFISKISAVAMGKITESNYYVSNLLLWFSALILPFSGTGWKEWKKVWGFGLFHFLLTALIFVQPYYNIYTDQATGYWSGALIAWFLLEKCSRRNVYLIPMILLNIGLMKSMMGPMFAVIVILAIVVLYCSARLERREKILPNNWEKIVFSKKGLFGCLIIIAPVLFMGIWSLIIRDNGVFRSNDGLVKPGEEKRLILTIKSMLNWIFESVTLKEDSLYLSYGIFFLITLGMVFIIYPLILNKKKLVRYYSLMYMYIAGFAGYFLIMLFAYMKVFGYVDSIHATSLNRYFSDYMILGVVPLTIPLFHSSDTKKGPYISVIKKGIIFVSLLCIVYGSSDYFLQNLVHIYALDTKRYADREKMISYAKKVKKLTNETGKIYFINQKRSGLFTLVADYEMGEQLSRGGMCFKFREDTSEGIMGLTDYPIETLPDVLEEQGYEYLWVYSTNEYFNENMEELFGLDDIKNGRLYKVIKTKDGVELEYVGKVK